MNGHSAERPPVSVEATAACQDVTGVGGQGDGRGAEDDCKKKAQVRAGELRVARVRSPERPPFVPGTRRTERQATRQHRLKLGLWFVFAVFSIMALNLNRIVSMAFGRERLFSGIALLLSIAAAALLLDTAVLGIRGSGRWLLGALGTYLVIGTVVETASGNGSDFSVAGGLLITIGLAVIGMASGAAAEEIGITERALALAVGPLALGALSVYFSPMIPGLYRRVSVDLDQDRLSGVWGNPNEAALMGCYALALLLALPKPRRLPLVPVVLQVALLGAIVLTFSRGGIVGAVLLLILAAVSGAALKTGRRLRIWALVAPAAWASALLWGVVGGGEGSVALRSSQARRLQDLTDIARFGEMEDDKTGSRLALGAIGLEMWLESPFVGNGLGQMQEMKRAGGLGAHNTFLVLLGEAGVVPFALFAVWLVKYSNLAKWRSSEVLSRFCILTGVVVFQTCMTGHNMLTQRVAILVIAFGSGAQAVKRRSVARRWRARALVRSAMGAGLG